MATGAPRPLLKDRHPGVQNLMRWLTPNPRLTGTQQHIASQIHTQAVLFLDLLDDGPELIAGLRHLLDAKDCLVRQSIADEDSQA